MLTRRERIAACVAELQKLGQEQERHKQEKLRAYENCSGALAKDAYLKQRAEIDSRLTAIQAQRDEQEQLLAELEKLDFQDKAQEDDVFTSYAGATELTAELAGGVYPGDSGVLPYRDRDCLEVPGCVRYTRQ